jgi:DNA polymerase sigma
MSSTPGEVHKPVGHGVSLFSKFSAASGDLCPALMPDAPSMGNIPLSSDLKAKLKQRQDSLRIVAQEVVPPPPPQLSPVDVATSKKGKDGPKSSKLSTMQPTLQLSGPAGANSLLAPRAPRASSLSGSSKTFSEVSGRSVVATSSQSSTTSDGKWTTRKSGSTAAMHERKRARAAAADVVNVNSADGDSTESSSSSSRSSTTATSTTTSSAADVVSNTPKDDVLSAGSMSVPSFSDDFYKFEAKVTQEAVVNADSVAHAGPMLHVTGAQASFDPKVYTVIEYKFGNGQMGQLAVPLWSAARYQRTGALYCTTNVAVALHEEIMDLFDWLRPTEAELVMRRLIEVELSDIAHELWPKCTPCAYGSLSTHLMLPTSDVDMTILDVPVNTEDGLLSICREVSARRLGATTWPQMILKTKVPLVKFATRLGNIEVDVSINAGDGQTNSEVVRALCARFPESKVLIPIVKYFLGQREMNEPFRGTLGSFATTLLVLSFLQLHPIYTTHTHQRAQYGLGRLLMEFFRYYALSFNYHRVGLSLAQGGSCFMRASSGGDSGPRGPAQVLVEDPGNSTNNVASSLRMFQNVRTAFDGAYAALTADAGVTRLTNPVDVTIVNPTSPFVVMRPTMLSRIFHSDRSVADRREKADAGLAEFEATCSAETVKRVKAHKRSDDEPLLSLPVHKPMHDVAVTLAELATYIPSPLESMFTPPHHRVSPQSGAAAAVLPSPPPPQQQQSRQHQHHQHREHRHQQHQHQERYDQQQKYNQHEHRETGRQRPREHAPPAQRYREQPPAPDRSRGIESRYQAPERRNTSNNNSGQGNRRRTFRDDSSSSSDAGFAGSWKRGY